MEQEFITNQELRKPREEQDESDQAKVDDIRGTPLSVGTLEELIDDNSPPDFNFNYSEHFR